MTLQETVRRCHYRARHVSDGGILRPTRPAASGASLTGAGSTLVAPLEATWAIDFERRYGDSVVYSPVGSGAGIAQITARTVGFGASDAPLTPSQAEACKAGSSPAEECIQIPWALSGIGISFNLPGIHSLHLTGPVIAEIYLGQITNWDASPIKKLNKGVKLPNLKITPAYRSDGSGDHLRLHRLRVSRQHGVQGHDRQCHFGQLPHWSGRQGQRRRDRGRTVDRRGDRLYRGLLHHRARPPGRRR